jgi:hypothetical protein
MWKMIDHLPNKASSTSFDELGKISEHYLVGRMYADLAKENEEGQKEARRLAEEGNASSQQGNFGQAADKLQLGLFHARRYMTADDTFIATCKGNYNETLEKQNAKNLASSLTPVAKRIKTQE